MAARNTLGDFAVHFGRFYGIWAAVLAVAVAVLAGLERLGAGSGLVLAVLVLFALCFYAGIGLLSRTIRVVDFFVGRRTLPSPVNGAAIATGSLSTLLLLVLVGGLTGGALAAALAALAAALAFVAVFVAPYLRKLGAYTVSEFLAARFHSRLVGFLALAVAVLAAFLHLVAMLDFAGFLASRYLGFGFEATIWLGIAAILSCVLLGGMRALTWTELAQAVFLALAALVPALLGSAIFAGTALPAGAAAALRALDAAPEAPLAAMDGAGLAVLLASFALGTAMLAPTLTRAVAAADPPAARRAFLWAIPVLLLFGTGLPAWAAFAITGPQGLAATVAALLSVGALSAALATASGLALSLAAGLANDLWFRTIDRRAPAGRRLLSARILMVAIVASAGFVALAPPAGILAIAALALGLAAGGLLPALVLAIWWRRCTAGGAAAAIVAGAATALVYGLAGQFGALAEWPLPGAGDGLAGLAAGTIGIPVGLLAGLLVSLLGPAPSPELGRILDEIRRPRGDTLLGERPA